MWSDRTPRARGEQIWVVNSTLLNSQHKSHRSNLIRLLRLLRKA